MPVVRLFAPSESAPVVVNPIAAVLHNLSLAPAEIENDLSDADILPTLTALLKLDEAALRATIHSDYRQLDEEVGKYLIGKYGN